MRYAIQNSDGSFNIDFIGNLFPSISFPGGMPDSVWLTANGVSSVVDSISPTKYSEQLSVDPYLLNGMVYTVKLQNLTLESIKLAKIILLRAKYEDVIIQDVTYTSASGETKDFQSDKSSVDNLQSCLAGCQLAQATPTGFFWISSDNTRVPFTFSDLQGLAASIFAQGAEAFSNLQKLKSEINASITLDEVQSIDW